MAQHGIAEGEALEIWMKEKSEKFREKRSEAYVRHDKEAALP